jgi:tripartite-type tricarboxylate transporter receptor subunit TctC
VKRFVHIALCFAVLTGWSTQRAAQGFEATSFADKRINVLIGFSAIGIGYDAYGRILARYLGRHLPGNPNVVSQNRPGAGSLTLDNYLYNVAPRDGTKVALIGRRVAANPIIGEDVQKLVESVHLISKDVAERAQNILVSEKN